MISGFQDDDLPLFARIDDIMVITATPVLSVRVFRTVGINSVMQLNMHISLVTQLVHPEPHQRLGDKNIYIALRTYVPRIEN